jgi:transposase InsO family protein
MARAEVGDVLQRYRRIYRKLHRQALHVLHWQVPGSVWAMDYAEAPSPIDGLYPYFLAVRDLTSGQQLLAQPVAHATADEALLALRSLFTIHGAPLVLKTDNGSPFCAGDTLNLLHHARVIPLFSPPYTLRYNGAIEAGIGSLKTRTDQQAARQGHPGHWTWDNLQAALLQANATARPHGLYGPTPDELWATRSLLSADGPARFHASLNRQRHQAQGMKRGRSSFSDSGSQQLTLRGV